VLDLFSLDRTKDRNVRRGRQAVAKAVRDMANVYRWSHYRRMWVLTTDAYFNDGTVSIDFETRLATFSDSVPSWAAYGTLQILGTAGDGPEYEVERRVDATTLLLRSEANVAADIAEKKASMVTDAALDPLTARVACFACVGLVGDEMKEHMQVATAATDDAERDVVQSIMRVLGYDECRIVTWNGVGFDLPMIYKRAMILDVHPASFGAPPLNAWTKRYNTDRHYDLMQLWTGGGSHEYAKLDTVARLVLGASKVEFDVTTIAALIETPEWREKVVEYCLQDTRLTWALWQKFNGVLFA
jgi:hypothetical protein